MKKTYTDEKTTEENIDTKEEPKIKHETDENLENVSATAFSSEAEKVFKQNKFQKITGAIKKAFNPPVSNPNSKSDFRDRTIWTIFMLIGFIGVISLGNFYCSLLVLFIIMLIFAELIDLEVYRERNQEIKDYYLWNWWFFFVCIFFFYIRLLYEKLAWLMLSYRITAIIYRYHTLISFMLYLIGFLIFLRSLTYGKYRYQFRVFAFNHIILLIFGVQSSLIISNLFNGLVWFVLPCSLVICNDISAYIFGKLFGKTQLTVLSPKKTVEGFVGGMFLTIICCYILTESVLSHDFLLCPIKDISLIPFFRPSCDTSDFTSDYIVGFSFFGWTIKILSFKNMHFHTFFMGLFASLLAPLGGFFASGFKRAIKIKDFGSTIPGHGGLTDRMDCQMLMGVFTYIWTYHFLFFNDSSKINYIVSLVKTLNDEDKFRILMQMKEILQIK